MSLKDMKQKSLEKRNQLLKIILDNRERKLIEPIDTGRVVNWLLYNISCFREECSLIS